MVRRLIVATTPVTHCIRGRPCFSIADSQANFGLSCSTSADLPNARQMFTSGRDRRAVVRDVSSRVLWASAVLLLPSVPLAPLCGECAHRSGLQLARRRQPLALRSTLTMVALRSLTSCLFRSSS